MKFTHLYENPWGPFPEHDGEPSTPWPYRIGRAENGRYYAVPVDGRANPVLLYSVGDGPAAGFVRRGEWVLYTPDNVKENTVNLNIDFASIIEKADKRRATLQEIQEELQMLPQMTRQLRESLGYFQNIAKLHNSLDHEGQEVAGKPVDLLRGIGYLTGNLLAHVAGEAFDSDKRSLRHVFKELDLEWQE